jgi:hypothetical protein
MVWCPNPLKEFLNFVNIIYVLLLIYIFSGFLFIIMNSVVSIPLPIVIMISVGYLSSAISCSANLFHPSIKHHKIVNYFIALLGFIFIMNELKNKFKTQ